MKKISLTILGVAVMALSKAFEWAGIDVASDQIQTFLEVLVQVGALVAIWYGRWRQGDIHWYGLKKKK